MIATFVAPRKYVQGRGVLQDAGNYIGITEGCKQLLENRTDAAPGPVDKAFREHAQS